MTSRCSPKPNFEEASTPAQSQGPILKHKFEGHKEAIRAFVFLHDDVHMVSGSEDGTMCKWSCDTGLVIGEPWKGEGGGIYALALTPDGRIIGCGREDGSIQLWDTNGKMISGVWTGHHRGLVRTLSWSPNGNQLASGSDDGTILIREREIRNMSIKTDQIGGVQVLAYSPSGERIASGGYNTICIWNAKTAKLVVGPIRTPGAYVTSLVWSSDSTKFYFASDGFARVFDGKSGKLLHRFEHNRVLWSVALSPKHNVLACVGNNSIAQLWDTESHQQLGQLFHQNHGDLYYVSFSRDGRYVAYGGSDKKITLWVVRDVAPRLPAPTILQESNRQSAQQETRSNSPSSSCLDADATGGGGFIEEVYDNLYSGNFFQSSRQSLPLSSPGFRFPSLFSDYRLLSIFSRRCPPADESVPKVRSKSGFFSRHTRSNSSLELTTIQFDQPVPEGKVGEGKGENIDHRGSGNDLSNNRKDKGKQRDDDPSADIQSLPSDDPTPPTKLDSADNGNIWTWLMRSRGSNPTLVETAPIIEHPKVVKVFPARGFQRLVVMGRKRKTKLPKATYSIPLVASNTGGSSLAGQLSQALDVPLVSAHVSGSSQPQSSNVVSVQARPLSHLIVNGAQYSQVTGGPSTYASPSHFVTNYHTSHNIDSRSSIEGTCNRFLDKICFPCGHYYEDS